MNLHDLITSLRRRKKTQLADTPHLDPDLVRDALKDRHPDWRPIFGQSGGQETQLQNMGVDDSSGDPANRPLFLFFGWYRRIEKITNGYYYVRNAPDVHAFFGWLQVEQKVILRDRKQVQTQMPWAASHPHVACPYYDNAPNAIYIAPKPGSDTDRLILDGRDTGLPAAGVFTPFDQEVHTLTMKGHSRTNWRVPSWFYRDGEPRLGMHTKPARWVPIPDDSEHVQVRSVDIGQEFVFDSNDYEKAKVFKWVEGIVRAGQPTSHPRTPLN